MAAGCGGELGTTSATDSGSPFDAAPPDDARTRDGATLEDARVETPDAAADAGASTDAPLDADASCTSPCALGATTCVPAGLSTCTLDPTGCASWSTPIPCAPHQTCTATASTAACTCSPSTCLASGCAGTTVDTCAVDPDGCPYLASSAPCPTDPNGTTSCTGGACALACAAGYYLTGGTCAPIAAPRLIAPLSTATTTSQDPTLHWLLAPGTDGAEIDICRDRPCTNIATTFTVTGSSGAPPNALSKGVYFWRARGTTEGTAGIDTSPTWEFFVGARSAPVDTSWGTVLDVNGDGYADVLAGEQPHALLYPGGAAGLSTTAATVLIGTTDSAFGATMASAGDVNGDGFADVVVGDITPPEGSGAPGVAYVYLGSSSGLLPTAVPLEGPIEQAGEFGYTVSSAGDVNGDGYADVVVGDLNNDFTYSAYIFLGEAGLSTATPSQVVTGPTASGFGRFVAGAGDVNGDGFGDFVVGAYYTPGSAFVYLGSPAGAPSAPSLTFPAPSALPAAFGQTVAGVGDVDGDGFADIAVGMSGSGVDGQYPGTVYLFLGGIAPSSVPATMLIGPEPGSAFGDEIAGGDVNGDGYSDVVVGAPDANGELGAAYVYLSGPGGLSTNPNVSIGQASGFDNGVSTGGDIDGDGYADTVVCASSGLGGEGDSSYINVYPGSASGPSSTPALSLFAADGARFQSVTDGPP